MNKTFCDKCGGEITLESFINVNINEVYLHYDEDGNEDAIRKPLRIYKDLCKVCAKTIIDFIQ